MIPSARRVNRNSFSFLAALLLVLTSLGADLKITRFSDGNSLSVTNTYPLGVVTVMNAPAVTGPWTPLKNAFSVGSSVRVNFSLPQGTSFCRALAVDLTGTGSWLFSTNDILDLGTFVSDLTTPPDSVSSLVADALTVPTLNLLYAYGTVPDAEVLASLVDDMNAILQGPSIYDPNVFADVTLSPATQALLEQSPQGSALIRLHRMLLQDAYTNILAGKLDPGATNLFQSYGVLTTVAGSGNIVCAACDSWQPGYEGGLATDAALSSPHITMADRAGNLYIADKRAHAIRKVTLDGHIHTVAGTGVGGFGTTNPAPATSVDLNNPNGLYVFENGMFYILDRDNGLIRKVDTNGIMTTVVNHGFPISGGRGLWVSPDESLLYYANGSTLMRWDSTNGLADFVTGFNNLGNFAMDPAGHLVVADDRNNQVYRIQADGSHISIAGNGSSVGGGDGYLATETALFQVRGIWFLPTGGYFLATDAACQVWYVDTSGYIHLLLNGSIGAHAGDGVWVYDNPTTAKISNGKQITMDYDGNLILTESEYGYVRKIRFLRYEP